MTNDLRLMHDPGAALHVGDCDLDTLGAASAAVAVVRRRQDWLEWLVLADVTVVIAACSGRG